MLKAIFSVLCVLGTSAQVFPSSSLPSTPIPMGLTLRNITSSGFGAEIRGLDLNAQHSPEVLGFLKSQLNLHSFLVVSEQTFFSVELLREISIFFGTPQIHREKYSRYPGFDDINIISNMKNDKGEYIGLHGADVEKFHSDLAWTDSPTTISLLHSIRRATTGGDTWFSDSVAAYNALPHSVKERLTDRMATYSYLKSRPKVNGSYVGLSDEEVEAFHPVVHPAVITHPETHKKSIFASEADTTDLIGLPEAESESMLALLANQVKKPEFVYIHKWNDNDLVIWDNRVTQHRATGCPETFPRKLVRATISGAVD